ncbi:MULTISPECIES: hypothetical protein [unclassified Streptomyces]|uniref:hypothetical protein n=1 Tax=unclassified Streptomyces TaxID=2593676 RepID=UPI0036E1D136
MTIFGETVPGDQRINGAMKQTVRDFRRLFSGRLFDRSVFIVGPPTRPCSPTSPGRPASSKTTIGGRG